MSRWREIKFYFVARISSDCFLICCLELGLDYTSLSYGVCQVQIEMHLPSAKRAGKEVIYSLTLVLVSQSCGNTVY